MGSDTWMLVTTVGTRDDALRLARALVDQRLAACVQVSAIDSVYRWDGQVQQDAEHRLVIKTTSARLEAAEQAVRALHPYALPALHALPLQRVDPAYADWVAQETRAAGDSPTG